MTYLPETPGTNLATKPDLERLEVRFERLEVRVDALASDIRHLTQRMDDNSDRLSQRMDDNFDRLSQRLDRHAQIMAAGFIAMTTALIASGFLG